jgi:hypothetical protein
MNIKRAIGFGVLLWIFIFVMWSIIIFLPYLKDHVNLQHIVWYVVEIPLVLLLAKWYFKQRKPNIKEGFLLGVVALLVGVVLDVAITVPLFVKSYSQFYGSWMLYVGFVELLVLTTLAGWEFDGPVARTEKIEQVDKE